MKFESLMLTSLFTACLLVCVLTMGAMLTTHANVPSVAAAAPVTAVAHVNG